MKSMFTILLLTKWFFSSIARYDLMPPFCKAVEMFLTWTDASCNDNIVYLVLCTLGSHITSFFPYPHSFNMYKKIHEYIYDDLKEE